MRRYGIVRGVNNQRRSERNSFFGDISEAYRISYTKPKPCAQCGRAVDPNAHRLTKDGSGVLCPDCAIKEEEQ